MKRLFSTVNKCLFSSDFPNLASETSSYNKTLYNHLRKQADKDSLLNAEFMTLSQKTGDSDLSKLNEMRKQIANNSQQVKLYQEFRELFSQLSECAEIVQKETDQELKQLAKAEMEELQESVVAHSQDIVEVIIPKVDADKRDC